MDLLRCKNCGGEPVYSNKEGCTCKITCSKCSHQTKNFVSDIKETASNKASRCWNSKFGIKLN